MKLLIIVLILFSTVTIKGAKQNGSTHRSSYQFKSPFYRPNPQIGNPTQYWPRASTRVDIQNLASK